MFAHIAGRPSLRDITSQLQAQSLRPCHLGVKAVKRSTLADANRDRPAEFLEALFHHRYAKCATVAPKKRFRSKCKLYSFDSAVVDLCLFLFPWAKFRRTREAVKLQTLLDHDGYVPAFAQVTDAKTPDIAVARLLNIPPASITVFDRACIDFAWFRQLHEKQAFFVTRMKRAIKYKVLERSGVNYSKGLTSDQMILLSGAKAKERPITLRRIGYQEPETKKHYVFLTNIKLILISNPIRRDGGTSMGQKFHILVADDDEEDCLLVKEAIKESLPNVGANFIGDEEELMQYLHQCGAGPE